MKKTVVILLVEDDPFFREIFSKKLESEGLKVEIAKDGEKGIEKVRELKPDLVLMDMKMPIMNGIQALAKIKSDPELKDTKVVFLTSFSAPQGDLGNVNLEYVRQMGALDYITKEEDLEKTMAKIRALVK